MADLSKFKCPFDASKCEKIITRFRIPPSEFLHLGHLKDCLINFYYAKMYKGEMILRFDDFNPLKENINFEDKIITDLKTLGISWNHVSHTSDYYAKIKEYMTSLIKQGLAYADSNEMNYIHSNIFHGTKSYYKKNSVEENLKHWDEIQK